MHKKVLRDLWSAIIGFLRKTQSWTLTARNQYFCRTSHFFLLCMPESCPAFSQFQKTWFWCRNWRVFPQISKPVVFWNNQDSNFNPAIIQSCSMMIGEFTAPFACEQYCVCNHKIKVTTKQKKDFPQTLQQQVHIYQGRSISASNYVVFRICSCFC